MKYFTFIFSIIYFNCFIYSDNLFILNGIHSLDSSESRSYNRTLEMGNQKIVSNLDYYCGMLTKCRQFYRNHLLRKYQIDDINFERNDLVIVNINVEENIKRIKLMFLRNRYIVLLYHKCIFHSILPSSVVCDLKNEILLSFDDIIKVSYFYITDEINYNVLGMGIATILIGSDHITIEKGILYCNTFKELYQTINIIESYPHTIKYLQNDLAKHFFSKSYVFNQKKYIYYQFIHSKIVDELKLINNSSLLQGNINIMINTNSHSFISLPSIEKVLNDSLYKYVRIIQESSIAENIFVRLLHLSNNNSPQVYELFISVINQTESSDTMLTYLYTHLLCSLEKRKMNYDWVILKLNTHFLNSSDYDLYCDMVNYTSKTCFSGMFYYSSFFDNIKESRTYQYIDLIVKIKYSFEGIKNSLEKTIELLPLPLLIYTYVGDIQPKDRDIIYPNKYTKMIYFANNNQYDYFCLYKKRIETPDNKKLLIFYVSQNNIWFKPYGPSSLGGFLGGSEESLIEELGELGYWVEVYCEMKISDQAKPKFTKSGGCIIWYPIECLKLPLNNRKNLLLFILFRTYHGLFLVEEERNYEIVIWLKDINDFMTELTWINSYLDYVIIQSEFHKSSINKVYYNRTYLINVQLYTQRLDLPLMNKNNIFIYASQPNRGLDRVLTIWDYLHRMIPGSELHVFYDFHQNFVDYLKRMFKDDEINVFLYTLYSKRGIILHGGANQYELSNYFAKAGFLLYPTTYPEVGCISCLKAMSYGCIPITSLCNESVIPEITKEYDLGCEVLKNDVKSLENYAMKIIEAVKMNLTEKRIKMKKWANEKFSIKTTIKVWERLISNSQIKQKQKMNNNNN